MNHSPKLGRPRLYSTSGVQACGLSLPRELVERLDKTAKENGVSRSTVAVAVMAAHLGIQISYASKPNSLPSGAIVR
mgnify:CR=1 FL=1